MVRPEANLITHYFNFIQGCAIRCGVREGALKGDLYEVDDLHATGGNILWGQHLSETCKCLVQDFYFFLAEVDSFALEWVRQPKRTF